MTAAERDTRAANDRERNVSSDDTNKPNEVVDLMAALEQSLADTRAALARRKQEADDVD